MKAPSKNLKDIRLENDMIGLNVNIKLFEDFDEGLKHFKKFFSAMKSSLDPFGVKMLAELLICSPYPLIPKILFDGSKHFTMTFSNAAMCFVPMFWNGV